MRPELIKKIRELLLNGAKIYGPPPLKSPSLEDYPSADEDVRVLSEEIWKDLEKNQEINNVTGNGELFYGQQLSDVLERLEVVPDVSVEDTTIRWTHRHSNGRDIYFISNQEARSKEIEISFRVKDKIPEIWDPATGEMYKTANFRQEGGRIGFPLKLDVHGSVFVVFREPASRKVIHNISFTPARDIPTEFQTKPVNITYSDEGDIILTTSKEGNYTFTDTEIKEKYIQVSGIPSPVGFDHNWKVFNDRNSRLF